MPSLRVKAIDFQEEWSIIQHALESALQDPYAKLPRSHTSLYTCVYHISSFPCTNIINIPELSAENTEMQSQPHALYVLYARLVQHHVQTWVAPRVVGFGMDLLKAYVTEWERFNLALKTLGFIMHYLNKEWVTKHQVYGDIVDTTQLALSVWREHLFMVIRDTLTRAVLEQITNDRDGIAVDRRVLKTILSSYVYMSSDKKPAEVYQAYFEVHFLAVTEQYYHAEIERQLMEKSLPEYMQKIEERLLEEQRRLTDYLDRSSLKSLKTVLVKLWIENKLDVLLSQCVSWLDGGQHEHLRRLFFLLQNSEGGLDPLRKIVEDRIDADGRAELEKVQAEASKDPAVFADTIFAIYKKYRRIVREVFAANKDLTLALEKGCNRFVNKNCLTAKNQSRSALLLAKYCNLLLKPGSKLVQTASDAELEERINNVMTVFNFIDDKDVFQKMYSELLCGRLVHGTFEPELETGMIGKLKQHSGNDYTYKLQRMFNDTTISAPNMNKLFEAEQQKRGIKGEFNFMILTQGSWPLTIPAVTFALPPTLATAYAAFEHAFSEDAQFNHKKLRWVHHCSHGSIKTGVAFSKPRQYELTVNTYQLPILLHFNTAGMVDDANPSIPFSELQQVTDLPAKELIAALGPFLRHKLLTTVENSSSASESQSYAINIGFHNNQRKIPMNTSKEASAADVDGVLPQMKTDDRRYAIQAAIVRVMKSRKRLDHQSLVQEVVNQLKSRFVPSVADVKANIDVTIEKEMLERDDDDGNFYVYV